MTIDQIQQAHHSIENALEIRSRPQSGEQVERAWAMVQKAHELLSPAVTDHQNVKQVISLIESAIEVRASGSRSATGAPQTGAIEEAWSMVHQAYELLTAVLKSLGSSGIQRPGQALAAQPPQSAFNKPAPPARGGDDPLNIEQCALDIYIRSQAGTPDAASAEAAFQKAISWARAVVEWRQTMDRMNANIDREFIESVAYNIYTHVQSSNVPHVADANASIEKAVGFARMRLSYRHQVEMGSTGAGADPRIRR